MEFLDNDMAEMGKTMDGLLRIGPYAAAWFHDTQGNIIQLSEVSR